MDDRDKEKRTMNRIYLYTAVNLK